LVITVAHAKAIMNANIFLKTGLCINGRAKALKKLFFKIFKKEYKILPNPTPKGHNRSKNESNSPYYKRVY
jgi:hypothetical protein